MPTTTPRCSASLPPCAQVAPDATGTTVGIQESSRTIVKAFLQAGLWALLSITILLAFALRRVADVLLTLAPLTLAGLVTLGTCVAIDLPLNFENIIALPLLFGIGVAFSIYFVMAWRSGAANLLQSSLTRAVLFSALTTGTAFGSLWYSHHPGTASMGKLLALSLAYTLVASLLFLPALLYLGDADAGDRAAAIVAALFAVRRACGCARVRERATARTMIRSSR